jgi:Flp pilus assembly protein TadG
MNRRSGNPVSPSHRRPWRNAGPGRRLLRRHSRRGAAVVELALVSPVWLTLLLGICEIGQALKADSVLSAAARAACGTASVPGTANVDVISDVKAVLSANGISTNALSVTILINGSAGDVSQAVQYSQISIKVSIPTSQVVVVNLLTYLRNTPNLSQTMTIIRQG